MRFKVVKGVVALTDDQREQLPYLVLVDPARKRGAAYASGQLILNRPSPTASMVSAKPGGHHVRR